MNPEIAKWLLTGARAFQEDPQLASWKGLSREAFVDLLNSIFHTEEFDEAVSLLQKVVDENLIGPSLPPQLKEMVEEWEKAQKEQEEIRQKTALKVKSFLQSQKDFSRSTSETGKTPRLPLAGLSQVKAPTPTQTLNHEIGLVEKKTDDEFINWLKDRKKIEPQNPQIGAKMVNVFLKTSTSLPLQENTQENDSKVFFEEMRIGVEKILEDQKIDLSEPEKQELVTRLVAKTHPLVETVATFEPSERETVLATTLFQREFQSSVEQQIDKLSQNTISVAQKQKTAKEVVNVVVRGFWGVEIEKGEIPEPENIFTIIEPEITQKLQDNGISFTKQQTNEFLTKLTESTKKEGVNVALFNPSSLPKSVLSSLKEGEGVAFIPLYTLLQPQAGFSYGKKVALAPIVKTLQFLDKMAGNDLKGEAVNEWRQILHQGLTSSDIQASILAFQQAGLSPQDPIIKKLMVKMNNLQVYEQAHPKIAALLKHYHEFSKITGRRQIYLQELKIFLPKLATHPLWGQQKGYSWSLRQALNKIGLKLGTHQQIAFSYNKTVIRFTLPNTFTKILTLGRYTSSRQLTRVVGRYTIKALGKTAVGQLGKKAAVWALTRLGLAAIPTGVTQAVAAGLILFDLLKALLKRPALLITLGIGLMALPFLISLAPFLGILAFIAGAIAFIVGIATTIGGFIGGIVSGITSFAAGIGATLSGALSALTTATVSATLPAVAVVGIGASAGLTLITTMDLAGAFVKPPTTAVGMPVARGACSIKDDVGSSQELRNLFINAGQWAGVPPAIIAAVASIEGNYMFSYSDDQVKTFSDPGVQVPTNCQPNGCHAQGPMQFLTKGIATDCQNLTGQEMPDVWGVYQSAVNKALPSEPRTSDVCNLKDSVYAAVWKIKTDSETTAGTNCNWNEAAINKAMTSYYGNCSTTFAQLGNKTYCQYVIDYYKEKNVIQTPSPSGWFYWQGDARWGNYGGSLSCVLANTGCGPTSMAMVLTFFSSIITPPQMWDHFVNRNYLNCSDGSSWSAMVNVPNQYSLNAIDLGNSWDQVSQKLDEGSLVIASTTQFGGHFVVIRKIDGNNVTTNDPAYNNGDGAVYGKNQFGWRHFWAIKR